MNSVRVVLFACLASLCGVTWGAETPAIPPGARVGIIDLVTYDVTHFHVGRSDMNSFLRTYRVAWRIAEIIDDPLWMTLIDAGFEPAVVTATATLRQERQPWLIQNPQARKLSRGCLDELERIMVENKLAALVIVAPGANTDPEFVEGNRWNRLPNTTQGFGFSTSDEPDGVTKPAVFDFTQIIVIARTDERPKLVARDWGGNRRYDWPGFNPGADLKALSLAQLAPMQPIIADAMKKRIATRILPMLKP